MQGMNPKQQFDKYATSVEGQEQYIDWVWYSTKTYTSTTTTKLSFFNTVDDDKALSNMEVASMFPKPKDFLLCAIRVVPLIEPTVQNTTTQATAITNLWRDVYRLMFNSYCILKIESKEFLVIPTHMLPAGSGITGFGSGLLFGVTTAQKDFVMHANHGVPDPRAIYAFNNKLAIKSQKNFSFEMFWTSAQTLSGNTAIQVIFEGKLGRSVQ